MATRNKSSPKTLDPNLFRKALESVDDAIALFDEDDRLVFYNRPYLDLHPDLAPAFDGLPTFEELMAIAREKQLVDPLLANHDWSELRLERHQKADGRPFLQRLASGQWLRIAEVRLDTGAVVTIQADVTDMVDEQRRRKAQSQLLQDTLDAIDEGLCVIDEEGTIVVRNQKACDLLQVSDRLLVPGAPVDHILTQYSDDPRDNRLLFEFFCPERPDGASRHFEVDEYRTFELRAFDLDSGGIVAVIKDISERSRVREMNRELAAFPRENPHPVVSANGDGRVTYANDAVENLLQELELDHTTALLPDNHTALITDCLRTGEVIHGVVSERKDRVFEWTYRPQRRGNLVHIYGSDVTDRLAAEAKRIELEGALHHAQKMEALGSLAGGIAHEFNNMLMPMLGLAELTMKRLDPDSVEYRNLERIHAAGQRAKGLVSEILSFGRLQDMTVERFSLRSVLEDSVKLLQSTMPSSITFDFHSDIPDVYLRGNPSHIQQILMNLCANAIHAIDGQIGEIKLIAEMITADDRFYEDFPMLSRATTRFVKIAVTDCGHGIDEADLDRIFDPFFTTKSVGQGTGLGLSVVHGVIQQFGGDISVSSRKGEGTRFDIYLPVGAVAEEAGTDDMELQASRE